MTALVNDDKAASWKPQPENSRKWDRGRHTAPNVYLTGLIASSYAVIMDAGAMDVDDQETSGISRTELDTHANMPVVGRNAFVVARTGETVDVSPFTPDYKPMQCSLVDAALLYECPYSGDEIILLVRNALYVPNMENNLIPPFVMREAGVTVDDTPKIQTVDPTVENHAIYFQETGLRIPLSLHGVFSFFSTSKPSLLQLQQSENIYMLTLTVWDPHNVSYAINEAAMLDCNGEMVLPLPKTRYLMTAVQDNDRESFVISSLERSRVEKEFTFTEDADKEHGFLPFLPQLDCSSLLARMKECLECGEFSMAIGATTVSSQRHLYHDGDATDAPVAAIADDTVDLVEEYFARAESGDELDELMISAAHGIRHQGVDAAHLSKVWRIEHKDAERTLEVTDQRAVRQDNPKLARNYGTNDRMLRYKHIKEYFYMDTLFATSKTGKSERGHTCCQLFVSDKGFVHVVPMRSKGEVLQAMKEFAKEVGAPDAFICDASGEQTRSLEVRRFCRDIGSTLRALEENTPWSNKAELYIGLLKEAVRKDMKEANSPMPLWDYCLERRARINNMTARDRFNLHGQNPYTLVTGDTGDISNLCQFGWYEWVYFRDQKNDFPVSKEILGRVLGPAKGAGNEMAQWVLKANGRVVPRRTVRSLTIAELHSDTEKRRREIFDGLIERRWGTAMIPPPIDSPVRQKDYRRKEHDSDEWEPYQDGDETPREFADIEEPVDSNGVLLNEQPAYDRIINAEVQLQKDGGEVETARVVGRTIGDDGRTIGTYSDNPTMNTVVYDVEFADGVVREYSANLIAQNMIAQCDDDGFSKSLMEGIVDYKKEETALSKSEARVVTRRGQPRLRKTTQGWKLLVRWRDGNESWVHLKDLKDSHPVETAEFAVARGIDDEPAFSWWVPMTLRKRNAILGALKTRLRRTTHKYGIEIPRDVAHAHEIDRRNGNTFWRDAIAKEMYNVGVAFEILGEGKKAPPGWTPATGHLVFDVKMDFTRKARWVLDGHKTADPIGSTYAGVVSRESVRIAFTYAALNGVDICAADIRNAYLQAPSSQKHYVICGIEFGLENVGRVALIHRALYGGKSAGRDFRNHLRAGMLDLGFTSCLADPDVWMRPAKKADGSSYYEYILLYTDDTLCVSENPERVLREEIGKYFELKEESIGPPKIYLGGRVRKVELENGTQAWSFSSSQYVQAAVANVEKYVGKLDRWNLPAKADTPMRTSYRSELDVSPELDPTLPAYYMSLIGVLRWIVELGRVDICLEVSILSSFMAMPREGHFEQVLHIFAYLKKYHNAEMVFDPTVPFVDEAKFQERDWASSEFGHVQGQETIPTNMPEPRGIGFVIRAKVDADHASDSLTRRSRTGFLVYLNMALVCWHSKKQTSVESSSFGSEFVAMKQCCEYLRGLRYKLRMMGIPVDGPCYIEGDNQSVLANATIPDSTLKKKSQSIAYHFVRDGVARSEWRTCYVNTHDNEADLLTKQLPHGEKRVRFVSNLLDHIFRSGLK